jgi:glutamyl-tRNA synthetase
MEMEPMAINSLLAALGTSDAIVPHQNLSDLVQSFDLHKISRSTPKFDLEEMKAINAKILHLTPYAAVKDRLNAMGLGTVDEAFWNMARANIFKLSDVKYWWHVAHGPVTPTVTEASFLNEALEILPQGAWDESSWGAWTNAIKAKTGRKGKELFMPLRLALTGVDHGPEMKLLLPMIGETRAKALLAGKAA